MLWLAFLTGFISSLHCVGMCGPIALAIPIPKGKKFTGVLLYNLGRSITYAIIGMMFGTIGLSLQLSGFQKVFAIVLGIGLLAGMILSTLMRKAEKVLYSSDWIVWLKQSIISQFQKKTKLSTLVVGMLNGLLPCGMVYLAAAGSTVAGSTLGGVTYMLCFALGTFPAMMSFGFFGKLFQHRYSTRYTLYFTLLVGIIFIYRGIAFDLPALDATMSSIGLGKISTCGQ